NYDAAGHLTRIRETTVGGTLADQQYTLNAEGEPTSVARTLPLDPVPVGQIANLSYNDASQISSAGYAYDARGRQTSAPGKSFAYDGASRLVRITADGISVTLTYNDLGHLRTRAAGAVTTSYYHHYALGLAPIVAETTSPPNPLSYEERGEQGEALPSPSGRGAGGEALPSPSGRGTGGEVYKRFYVYTPGGGLLYSVDAATRQASFYHFDHLGSTLFLSGAGGAVSDAYAYDPYGNLLGHSGSSDQPFTYAGRYGVRWEAVGELYQMGLRYYDPLAARFLTRDPLWPALPDPLSLNPYGYARQNPLRYVDPLGTDSESVVKGVNGQLAGDGSDWSEYLALFQAQMHDGTTGFGATIGELTLEGQLYWLEGADLPDIAAGAPAGPDTVDPFMTQLQALANLSPEQIGLVLALKPEVLEIGSWFMPSPFGDPYMAQLQALGKLSPEQIGLVIALKPEVLEMGSWFMPSPFGDPYMAQLQALGKLSPEQMNLVIALKPEVLEMGSWFMSSPFDPDELQLLALGRLSPEQMNLVAALNPQLVAGYLADIQALGALFASLHQP
ncbi:MAG: hypothetical protein FJ026_14620, partial [Chloroflexi bacterium]|nr:hypothetical protein [Chloroflexota bacterium]